MVVSWYSRFTRWSGSSGGTLRELLAEHECYTNWTACDWSGVAVLVDSSTWLPNPVDTEVH